MIYEFSKLVNLLKKRYIKSQKNVINFFSINFRRYDMPKTEKQFQQMKNEIKHIN